MTRPLSGYTIGVTADRRSDEQISLLAGRGATCVHGPVIRTHAFRPEAEVREATVHFLKCRPDIVVFTTGIGVRGWIEAADSVLLGERLRHAFANARLLSRGPKAHGAAITADLDVEWNAPKATSQEVIDRLAEMDIAGKTVAIQLDGASGNRIVRAAEQLGATALPVPVYRWSLPEDLEPARNLVHAAADQRLDAVTFTARPAVENFVAIARELGRLDDVISSVGEGLPIFCIGPVCAAAAIEGGLGKPVVPKRSKLGAMIVQITSVLGEGSKVIELGGRTVAVQGRLVSVDDKSVTLTERERQVLDLLIDRPGVLLSKTELLQRVWGCDQKDPHVVEVTIGRLRRRLGPAGEGIETIVRRGYRTSAYA